MRSNSKFMILKISVYFPCISIGDSRNQLHELQFIDINSKKSDSIDECVDVTVKPRGKGASVPLSTSKDSNSENMPDQDENYS